MPLVKSGSEASSETFHNGGPGRPARIESGFKLTTPGGLRAPMSTWFKSFGSTPAYSSAKTGMSAPIIVSAERARAPTDNVVSCMIVDDHVRECDLQKHMETIAAILRHFGRLRGSAWHMY